MRLTVIIPTWNEAPLIANAVDCARLLAEEVIVADGGSTDGTAEIARAVGCRVVASAKGRGVQVAAAARVAMGDVLLVLHADARLPPSARRAIERALADPTVPGGNFLVRFLPESRFTRVLVPFNDVRRRVTRRYYGDSAIFVRAEACRRLGPVLPWKVMMDYEYSARLESLGRGAYIREPAVWVSSRRFQGREGRTVLTWFAIQTLYRLGVPPRLLERLYPDMREREPGRFVRDWNRSPPGRALPKARRGYPLGA